MLSRRALTSKQQRFLDALIAGATPSDAYRQAYDCARMRPRTISAHAYKLSRQPLIAAALDRHRVQLEQAREAATERAAAEAGVTRERIVAELAAIAFADIRQVATWSAGEGVRIRDADSLDPTTAAAILELKRAPRDGAVSVKLHPKLGALQALAKLLKLDVADGADKPGTLSFIMKLAQ